MLVVVGLLMLLAAATVGVAGVLTNAEPTHPLTDDFAVFGYRATGSTSTLLLYGILIGLLVGLGLGMLLAGARPTASRGRTARSELERRESDKTAGPVNDTSRSAAHPEAVGAEDATAEHRRFPFLGGRSRDGEECPAAVDERSEVPAASRTQKAT